MAAPRGRAPSVVEVGLRFVGELLNFAWNLFCRDPNAPAAAESAHPYSTYGSGGPTYGPVPGHDPGGAAAGGPHGRPEPVKLYPAVHAPAHGQTTGEDPRIESTDQLCDADFANHRRLHGVGLAVNDGDTFRFWHQPAGHPEGPPAHSPIRDCTLLVRLAGIDAPETAHGDNPGQKMGLVSKEWLGVRLDHRAVVLELLSRDQYGRTMALVHYADPADGLSKCVNIESLRAGMASIYRGRGADYGGRKAEFEAAERSARERRVGVWEADVFDDPAQYKARVRNDTPDR